jgi:hypothetical protein
LESWDEAAGIEFEKRLRFVVGIYLSLVRGGGSWIGGNEPRCIGKGFFSPEGQGGLVGQRGRTSQSIISRALPFHAP